MPATASVPVTAYTLQWESYSQWGVKPDEIGGIYSKDVKFYTCDGYRYCISFRVGEWRTLGILFVEVKQKDPNGYTSTLNYSLGQFHNNAGAIKFAQFALHHFIETETWSVCPSFQAVEYIGSDPYTLAGDEIVSELI